ncbi:MAG: PEP-CTERM sorting domain-containing protein [Spirulinaceae cyanobacterium]
MNKLYPSITLALTALIVAPNMSEAAVFSASGEDAASIQGTVDAFRTIAGEPNNGNQVGPVEGGRRQIDWDGRLAPADPFDMPADFFNAVVPRGTVYETPGSGFQISGADGDPTNNDPSEDFGNINPTYTGVFEAFSAEKLFIAQDSNILDILFFVPGTDTAATVSSFGAVFSDVDLAETSKMEFFDVDGNLIQTNFVEAVADRDESFSFLGVTFDDFLVSKVRITSGNAALGADTFDGNGVDLVALDDFIFSEPQAVERVPEPSSLLSMLLVGVFAWLPSRKLRKFSLTK